MLMSFPAIVTGVSLEQVVEPDVQVMVWTGHMVKDGVARLQLAPDGADHVPLLQVNVALPEEPVLGVDTTIWLARDADDLPSPTQL
jgi:hypothetical protein